MFKLNSIANKQKDILFLQELTDVLNKHKVTMYYGDNHIHFNKENKLNFAQCHCVNGGSTIDK